MRCSNCDRKVDSSAAYCPNCGSSFQEAAPQRSRGVSKRSSYLMWLIPLISFLFVSGGLLYYYTYEQQLNRDVLIMKRDAEQLALAEEYASAEEKLNSAIVERPEYAALHKDLAEVQLAARYHNKLVKSAVHLKKQQFEEATSILSELASEMENAKGPLIDGLYPKVKDTETKITIGKIKAELNDLQTIEQLAEKLSTVNTLTTDEAAAVKEAIIERMITVAIEKADHQLKDKEFTDALTTLEQAILFAGQHNELLNFQQTIKSEQIAFENAEQQRIEQAMLAAAEEEIKNKTAAVEVMELNANVSDAGELTVIGDIKNTATRPIESVKLSISVLTQDGSKIAEENFSITPVVLEPGETAHFEEHFDGVNEQVKVEIADMSWIVK